MDILNTIIGIDPIIMQAAPDVDGFVDTARNFIAPIFMLIVGIIALSFLFRRQLSQFIQFALLVVLIGVLFYWPGLIKAFATWVAGLFFGGSAPTDIQ